MFKKFVGTLTAQKEVERKAALYRNLIRHEARIGGKLFGPVRSGGRREFFCLDKHTWVWHEEWVDQHGQRQIRTTRYDIRPDGVLKAQGGQYQPVTPAEAKHLYDAMKLYEENVTKELYSFAQ
jgi:hypothetical protein